MCSRVATEAPLSASLPTPRMQFSPKYGISDDSSIIASTASIGSPFLPTPRLLTTTHPCRMMQKRVERLPSSASIEPGGAS